MDNAHIATNPAICRAPSNVRVGDIVGTVRNADPIPYVAPATYARHFDAIAERVIEYREGVQQRDTHGFYYHKWNR
jgi:hypothetical protein